jgi:hypothetical protein
MREAYDLCASNGKLIGCVTACIDGEWRTFTDADVKAVEKSIALEASLTRAVGRRLGFIR